MPLWSRFMVLFFFSFSFGAAGVSAQDAEDEQEEEEEEDPRGDAPPDASSPNEVAQPDEVPQDDDMTLETATPDPTPEVPMPLQRETVVADVVEQAGIGGPTAFASAGVLEVGGTGALLATGEFLSLRFAPFVGWFFADGFELTYSHELRLTIVEGERTFSTLAVLELSGHLKFGNRLLGFLGVGPGLLYAEGAAFALKSRLGLDVLVGRSGIFRPAGFVTYATRELFEAGFEGTGSKVGYGVEFSYSAMF